MTNRETREIYRGKAEITDVNYYKFTGESNMIWPKWEVDAIRMLPECDQNAAMKIAVAFKTDELADEVVLPYYAEECRGGAITTFRREDGKSPTQKDATLQKLVWNGVIKYKTEEALYDAVVNNSAKGNQINVAITEESSDGVRWYKRTAFATAAAKIVPSDKSAFGAVLAGKPAPRPTATATATPSPSAMPPAPAADDEDIPF